MGALFGFMDVMGRHMQAQNQMELEHQNKANAEMADMLDRLGKTAKPEYAPDYARAAMQIRLTPPGKKPPKEATDIYGLMLRQIKQGQQPQQQPQSQPQAQPHSVAQDPGNAFVDPAYQPSLMPPPGATIGAPTGGERTVPVSGAGMASLMPPPGAIPTPVQPSHTMSTTAQLQAPPGYSAPPGMELTQTNPWETMQMQAGLKSQLDQQNRQRLMGEAKQLFPDDIYAQANYINEKAVDRPTTTGQKWASAGQGIIYNVGTGETKLIKNEADVLKVLGPGDTLVDASGKVIATGQPKPVAPPNSAFESFLADFRATNHREPTTEEVLDFERRLRTASGEPMYQVLGPGSMPVWAPRSQAIGQPAPRTVYGPDGTPTTGGAPGVSLTPPPGISDTTQQSIAGMKDALSQFSNVQQMLSEPKFATLGPLMGRVKLAEINKLGGMGATPDELRLATTLQRLLSSQAFAEGGKQLTSTELEQFKLITPSFNDTVASATIKTREAIKFLNQKMQNRISVMPVRQRNQLNPTITPPPTGSTNSPTSAPSGSGGVMMEVNGQRFEVRPDAVDEAIRRGARRVQ